MGKFKKESKKFAKIMHKTNAVQCNLSKLGVLNLEMCGLVMQCAGGSVQIFGCLEHEDYYKSRYRNDLMAFRIGLKLLWRKLNSLGFLNDSLNGIVNDIGNVIALVDKRLTKLD